MVEVFGEDMLNVITDERRQIETSSSETSPKEELDNEVSTLKSIVDSFDFDVDLI
jgi:hypothetical protein